MSSELLGLKDPRDLAFFSAVPMLVAPRFGALDPVSVGRHRFVAATDGIYLQARTQGLDVCLHVGETVRLPYGTLREYVHLNGGPIPASLVNDMKSRAVAAVPQEWAGVILYHPNSGYQLVEPTVTEVSRHRVGYKTASYEDEYPVLDVHSHGRGNAFFSRDDDESDQYGIYLAVVLGHCDSNDTITARCRVVVHGIFYNVDWVPWTAE